MELWRKVQPSNDDAAHYSVQRLFGDGMDALHELFPSGAANSMNMALFSTSGVHGTYATIEDAEAALGGEEPETITFLVLQPRLVCVRYGVCRPARQGDIDWLKSLRESSLQHLSSIGMPTVEISEEPKR